VVWVLSVVQRPHIAQPAELNEYASMIASVISASLLDNSGTLDQLIYA
jgi:hypothetical protein